MALSNQMEMFEDGGLKDEGGTIDPVSGNDVPSGSTQEEVRDDIPAQLSEGEFVFPADVTRFIGLNKLMQIRDEAKAGLQRMEDMGQMGNSEEATLPDDTPFDINDLDMSDEEETKEEPREMAQGGIVKAAAGTFINPGTGLTSIPSQFAGMSLPSANTVPSQTYTVPTVPSNASGYTPKFTAQTGQQDTNVTPSFNTLIGKNPGQYDEMRTYTNDAGQTMDIPFKNGEPIYPIPEGYTFVDPEAIETQAPTTTSTTPTNTRVVEQENDDNNNENNKGLGGAIMDVGGRTFAIGYNFDGSITLTDPKTMEKETFAKDTSIAIDAKNVTFGQILNLAKITPTGLATTIIGAVADKLNIKIPGTDKVETIASKAKASKIRLANSFTGIGVDKSTGMSLKNMQDIQKGLQKGKDGKPMELAQTDISAKSMQDRANRQASEQAAADKKVADARAAQRAQVKLEDRNQFRNKKGPSTVTNAPSVNSQSDDPSGGFSESYDSPSGETSVSESGYGSSGGAGDFNVGGLAGKKKTPKPKKMKRGGLASRK